MSSEFETIPGFSAYKVNQLGDVLGPSGRVLKPEDSSGYGHMRLSLSINGKSKHMFVHRLVALTFIGPPPIEKPEVCHIDGNPRNNNADNLRWGSRLDNGADMVAHGTSPKGERQGLTHLTEDDIKEIRSAYSPYGRNGGSSSYELGKMFNVSATTIRRIIHKRVWSHV